MTDNESWQVIDAGIAEEDLVVLTYEDVRRNGMDGCRIGRLSIAARTGFEIAILEKSVCR